MSIGIRTSIARIVALLIGLTWAGTCRASLTEIGSFSASGKNPASKNTVSATVTFYYDPSNSSRLIIDLVNKTTGIVDQLGGSDVLTGLAFNLSVNGRSPSYAPAPSSPDLTPSLTLSDGETTSAVLTDKKQANFANTWTSEITPYGNNLVTGAYGISASGFGGAFKGTHLQGPNYGIVNTSNVASGILPLAMNGLEFTLAFKSGLDIAKLSDVQFLFGTEGTGVLQGQAITPEPSTLSLAGLGAIGLLAYGLRRRTRG